MIPEFTLQQVQLIQILFKLDFVPSLQDHVPMLTLNNALHVILHNCILNLLFFISNSNLLSFGFGIEDA